MSQDTTVYSPKPEILTIREILGPLEATGLKAEWQPMYSNRPDTPRGTLSATGRAGGQDQIRISAQNVPDYEREEVLRTFANSLSEERRRAIREAKTSYTVSRSWSRDPARDHWSDHLIYLITETTNGLIYDHQDNAFYSPSEYRAKHAISLGPDQTVM